MRAGEHRRAGIHIAAAEHVADAVHPRLQTRIVQPLHQPASACHVGVGKARAIDPWISVGLTERVDCFDVGTQASEVDFKFTGALAHL